MLLDTLTNKMDLSVTDGQMIVGATSLAGDANGDASVDVTDVVNLVAFINGRHPAGVDSLAVDIDGNGLWDISDVTKLVVIINSAGVPTRSAQAEPEPLTLYRSDMSPKGNNLYIRQSAENPSRLEICLDNVEEVQAFQADLFLPEGLSIAEEQEVQPTERNAGQTLQIGKLPANRYRLLSYALKTDAAFHGKTGVLASLQLEGVDRLADGTYPVRMQQAVLTGMDRSTVRSQPWDAVLVAGPSVGAGRSIVFGTEPGSVLWVRGAALMQIEVWDLSGRRIVHKKLSGSEVFRTNLPRGNYIVRAQSATLPVTCQKVTVK
jgi:hypothetical protein